MTIAKSRVARPLSEDEIDARMAEVEKGQQLAGHYPDAEALGRARRILTGEITYAQACAEIAAKWPIQPK